MSNQKFSRKGPQFIYGAVKKIGTNQVVEITRDDVKTGKREIIFEDQEYKKLKKKLQLNQLKK